MARISFADYLDELARQTWFNMVEARRLGMRMGEVTLTEQNLLAMARFVRSTGLLATVVPTRPDESTTGADFEIWFRAQGRVVGYTIQAKVLKVKGGYYAYPEIGKTDKRGIEQAELLEKHAMRVGAFPFHLLLNGWTLGSDDEPTLPAFAPAEHFGCTVIATPRMRTIRRHWPRPTLQARHFLPESWPWSMLFRGGVGAHAHLVCACACACDVDLCRCAGRVSRAGTECLGQVDVEALRGMAYELSNQDDRFGKAKYLPDYVLRALEGESPDTGPGDYVPHFILVVDDQSMLEETQVCEYWDLVGPDR